MSSSTGAEGHPPIQTVPAAVEAPADDEAEIPIAFIRVHDIQGLYGGQAFYAWADGRMLSRNVDVASSGMRERRFEGRLSPEQLTELGQLVRDTGFLSLTDSGRLGIPDESRTAITIRFSDGTEHTVARWNSELSPEGFGALRGYCFLRAVELETSSPIYEGDFDGSWEPDAR